MIEQLYTKLISVLSSPVELIMFFWITTLLYTNKKLLAAQEERGVLLSKITVMIEMLLKGGNK